MQITEIGTYNSIVETITTRSAVNHIKSELHELDVQYKNLSVERILRQDRLKDYQAFNPKVEMAKLAESEKALASTKAKGFEWFTSAAIGGQGFDIGSYFLPAGISWLVDKLTASQRAEAKLKADKARAEAQAAYEARVKLLEKQVADQKDILAAYNSINVYGLIAEVKTIDCQIEIVQERRNVVAAKLQKLEDAIGPVLAHHKQLLAEAKTLQDINEALCAFEEAYIKAASNPSALGRLRQDFRRTFGTAQEPSDEIKFNLRKLDALKRKIRKVEERICEEERKLDLKIKRVFIDGNNLCNKREQYQQEFIGTTALEALATELLAKSYEVTIVFDHKIGKGHDEISFDRVQQNFESGVKLFQAAKGLPADEMLMRFASDVTDCIVSNDNFDDHMERAVRAENRVFRAIIGDRLAAIPMLSIDVCFEERTDPFATERT